MGVEQSASDKNVTLTLKEAMLEDGEFILNINMDFSKKELDKNDMITNYMPQIKDIYIDGKKFLPSSTMQTFGISEEENINDIKEMDNIDFFIYIINFCSLFHFLCIYSEVKFPISPY